MFGKSLGFINTITHIKKPELQAVDRMKRKGIQFNQEGVWETAWDMHLNVQLQ